MTNKDLSTLELAKKLISIASVTPDDNGCQDLLRKLLSDNGFSCLTLKDSGTENLLAVHGSGKPFFLFLGHTDVVSPGNAQEWTHDPFSAQITEGENGIKYLFGRGSQDMKTSDAAMALALCRFVQNNPDHQGTVGYLVTSNEEGDAKGGTPFVVDYLKKKELIPDYCVVGEPSCTDTFGDTIKNGRRGSVTAHITVKGVQGHVAYPALCDNAAHHAARLISELCSYQWDTGSKFFPPSSFQVTNVQCGNGAENVVPGYCKIMCNWRFNDALSPELIKNKVNEIVKKTETDADIYYVVNGLPFITKGGLLLESLQEAVKEVTGVTPALSTAGGTSDGRFIAPLGTLVVEFGPRSNLIHKVNEAVELDCIEKLTDIYLRTLDKIFK
ncbi:MAG: succinyl-diaminopimelate desuccinylase [Succinivibrio sp.]